MSRRASHSHSRSVAQRLPVANQNTDEPIVLFQDDGQESEVVLWLRNFGSIVERHIIAELVLLLDDGGVLNNNALPGSQWQRLVGEFFLPIFGGTPAAWAEANRLVAERLFEPAAWSALLDSAPDYASFERRYYCTWLGDMCQIIGLPRPPEEQCVELGAAAEAFVAPRVHSAFPGAVEAIRALHAAGFELHTASGTSSTMLAMYLGRIDIRDCFGRLYGPDLTRT